MNIRIYQSPSGNWKVSIDGVEFTFETETDARAFYNLEIQRAKIRPYLEAVRSNAAAITAALADFNKLKRDYVAGDLGNTLTEADFNGIGITKAQFIAFMAATAEIDDYAAAAGRYNAIREVKRL